MSDPWPPGDRVKTYTASGAAVRFDARRCAHAEECVKGLPEVFDPSRRPWIDPSLAEADAIAEVVARCPSGALHAAVDGVWTETEPRPTEITALPDGPLEVRGEFAVDGRREVRALLCRCGGSANKPWCDGTHVREGWRAQPGSSAAILERTRASYHWDMSDEWPPYPGHDPANPPPGSTPGTCLACQGTGRTWREYMAVGPLAALDLDPGEVGTVPVLGQCRFCRGRGWTWHTKLR